MMKLKELMWNAQCEISLLSRHSKTNVYIINTNKNVLLEDYLNDVAPALKVDSPYTPKVDTTKIYELVVKRSMHNLEDICLWGYDLEYIIDAAIEILDKETE